MKMLELIFLDKELLVKTIEFSYKHRQAMLEEAQKALKDAEEKLMKYKEKAGS